MPKFQIGDVVQIALNTSDYDGNPIHGGTTATVVEVEFDADSLCHYYQCWYVLDKFPDMEFNEDELELVSVPSINSDLEKRVSETRDKLLRDIFS